MGDNGDDDDDTFRDFAFASFPSSNPNQTVNSHHPQINGPKLTPISTNRKVNAGDDDEWGEFVSSPIRSNNQHQLPNAPSHTQSKPLDPFAFSSGNDNDFNLTESTQMKKRADWEKPKGPLPLSLFGDVEEELKEAPKEAEERSSVDHPQGAHGKDSSANVQNGWNGVSLNVGFNDIIANLYSYNSSPQIKGENGSVLNQNGSSFDSRGVNSSENYSILGLNELSVSSASVDMNKDLVNNDQKVNDEDKFDFNSNVSVLNPNIDASSLGSGGWSSILNDQSNPNKGENKGIGTDMSRLNSNQHASSSNLSASSSDFGGWSFDLNGFSSGASMLNANLNASSSNFNEMSSKSRNEELNGNGDDNVDDDDDDGWEFKDAFAEAKAINGVDKVEEKTHEMSDVNTNPSGFQSASNGAADLFAFTEQSVDLFSMSNGVSSDSVKASVELDSKSNTAAQVSFNSDTLIKGELKGFKSGLDSRQVVQGAENDEDFGEFTAAFPETRLRKEGELRASDISGAETEDITSISKEQVEVSAKVHDVSQLNAYASSSTNGSSRAVDLFAFSNESIDFFSMSNGDTGAPPEFGTDFGTMPSTAAQSGFISHTQLSNGKVGSEGGLDPHSVSESGENDDDFGEFAAAFSETGEKQEGKLPSNQPQSEIEATVSDGKDLAKKMKFENHKGALPLSIFGDEELEVDNTLDNQDAFLHSHSSLQGKGRIPPSVMSIDDLISNLYSQAEHMSAVDTLSGTTDIEASAATEISSDLPNDGDEFDGGSWEFKDAFAQEIAENEKSRSCEDGTTIERCATTGNNSDLLDGADEFGGGSWEFKDALAQERAEYEKYPSYIENGTVDIETNATRGINSDLLDDADDFDGGWEFKDASNQELAENEKSLNILEDAPPISPSKVRLSNYIDLYSKLEDGLTFVIKCHLEKLKKAQSSAALSGEDDKAMAFDEGVQEMCNELDQEAVISQEDSSEEHPTRDSSLNELLEALEDHKFQILESEYGLRERLSSAEKDMRSALELRKHVTKMLKVLKLGSEQDHLTYISIWSKMISVCAQELQSGANIWKQSSERNVLNKLLSEPEGKKFIQALGETYRVAMVLGTSAKLYKPWTFERPAESSHIYALVDECNSVWSTSGLGEALSDILHSTSTDDNNHVAALLDSIQSIHDLDLLALQDHVFTQQESICWLSLLTSEYIPGMKVVVWDSGQYFVKLANLWANLISSNPPMVPNLHFMVDEKVG